MFNDCSKAETKKYMPEEVSELTYQELYDTMLRQKEIIKVLQGEIDKLQKQPRQHLFVCELCDGYPTIGKCYTCGRRCCRRCVEGSDEYECWSCWGYSSPPEIEAEWLWGESIWRAMKQTKKEQKTTYMHIYIIHTYMYIYIMSL